MKARARARVAGRRRKRRRKKENKAKDKKANKDDQGEEKSSKDAKGQPGGVHSRIGVPPGVHSRMDAFCLARCVWRFFFKQNGYQSKKQLYTWSTSKPVELTTGLGAYLCLSSEVLSYKVPSKPPNHYFPLHKLVSTNCSDMHQNGFYVTTKLVIVRALRPCISQWKW